MSGTEANEEQPAATRSCVTWEIEDPIQKEISGILELFQYDIMGIISLGRDGIMRSLTADRKVLSAVPFRHELVIAFLKRFEGSGLEEWNEKLEGADGTKTPQEKWFEPDDNILPAPLPQERLDEVKNGSEEDKEQLRKLLREKENYVDSSGVLG
ncbi:hypothetical protein DE146DRAFT_751216 [Phaeosphaeria sp. MPI-PUGE-AT-0046c]|nr:hypothetical protein DE146DRAFT_751216 [Phaeosphaeria sp. MPI-PUGE-AT-0046c]